MTRNDGAVGDARKRAEESLPSAEKDAGVAMSLSKGHGAESDVGLSVTADGLAGIARAAHRMDARMTARWSPTEDASDQTAEANDAARDEVMSQRDTDWADLYDTRRPTRAEADRDAYDDWLWARRKGLV